MAAWTSNEFLSYKSQNSYNLLVNICLFTHSAIMEKYVNSTFFYLFDIFWSLPNSDVKVRLFCLQMFTDFMVQTFTFNWTQLTSVSRNGNMKAMKMPQKLNMWVEQVNNGLKSVIKGRAELGVHLHCFFPFLCYKKTDQRCFKEQYFSDCWPLLMLFIGFSLVLKFSVSISFFFV